MRREAGGLSEPAASSAAFDRACLREMYRADPSDSLPLIGVGGVVKRQTTPTTKNPRRRLSGAALYGAGIRGVPVLSRTRFKCGLADQAARANGFCLYRRRGRAPIIGANRNLDRRRSGMTLPPPCIESGSDCASGDGPGFVGDGFSGLGRPWLLGAGGLHGRPGLCPAGRTGPGTSDGNRAPVRRQTGGGQPGDRHGDKAGKREAGWREARPADAADRGAWWSSFGDPVLDGLMRQVEISNQNVAAAEASFRAAASAVAVAQAAFFPTVDATASAQRARTPGAGTRVGRAGSPMRSAPPGSASWVPDLWGRLTASVTNASGDGAGQRRRSCRCAPGGAGAARDRLMSKSACLTNCAGCSTPPSKPIPSCCGSARTSLMPGSCRPPTWRRRARRSRARRARAAAVGGHAGAARKRDRRADRQAAIGGQHCAGAGSSAAARHPGGSAVEPAGAPAGYRRGRAPNGSRQCAIGIDAAAFYPDITLSAEYRDRRGRDRQAGLGLEPVLVVRRDIGADRVRCRRAPARLEQDVAKYDRSVALYRQTVLDALRDVEDQLSRCVS